MDWSWIYVDFFRHAKYRGYGAMRGIELRGEALYCTRRDYSRPHVLEGRINGRRSNNVFDDVIAKIQEWMLC